MFAYSVHDIYFPYEIAQSLGQDAEVCAVFQRGDKFVTTYACQTNQMAHGPMEVTCSEALSLTVTLYKEAESRYMVHIYMNICVIYCFIRFSAEVS